MSCDITQKLTQQQYRQARRKQFHAILEAWDSLNNQGAYSPTNPANWSSVPTTVKQALDLLAQENPENASGTNYTPANSINWSLVPANVAEALDTLASELVSELSDVYTKAEVDGYSVIDNLY